MCFDDASSEALHGVCIASHPLDAVCASCALYNVERLVMEMWAKLVIMTIYLICYILSNN